MTCRRVNISRSDEPCWKIEQKKCSINWTLIKLSFGFLIIVMLPTGGWWVNTEQIMKLQLSPVLAAVRQLVRFSSKSAGDIQTVSFPWYKVKVELICATSWHNCVLWRWCVVCNNAVALGHDCICLAGCEGPLHLFKSIALPRESGGAGRSVSSGGFLNCSARRRLNSERWDSQPTPATTLKTSSSFNTVWRTTSERKTFKSFKVSFYLHTNFETQSFCK